MKNATCSQSLFLLWPSVSLLWWVCVSAHVSQLWSSIPGMPGSNWRCFSFCNCVSLGPAMISGHQSLAAGELAEMCVKWRSSVTSAAFNTPETVPGMAGFPPISSHCVCYITSGRPTLDDHTQESTHTHSHAHAFDKKRVFGKKNNLHNVNVKYTEYCQLMGSVTNLWIYETAWSLAKRYSFISLTMGEICSVTK